MDPQKILASAVLVWACALVPADAASLKVSPVTIERVEPAATATLTLTNTGERPIDIQIRVFRWLQEQGGDVLRSTRDVVASPPMNKLEAGVDYTVRIVRISKRPLLGEESYRILVDELPSREAAGAAAVTLVVRYSIPAFFQSGGASPAAVSWRVRYANGRFVLTAENSGAIRFKVGRTILTDARGRSFELSDGLLGYILGGSSMTWSLSARTDERPEPGEGLLQIVSDGIASDVPVIIHAGG